MTADHTAPWLQFICDACGYIYDEALGDPDSGLPPGTRFADIPDDWVCPLCGVTKADFSPYQAPSLDDLKAQARDCGAAGTSRPGRQAPGVVIVGAGRAGWTVAAALRARDANVPITLVTACSGDVYDKPLLSVALARQLPLAGLRKESGTDAAQRLNVRLLAHTHAIHIDAQRQQLRTTRGSLPYRQLVLAHGAQAKLPAGVSAADCWRINHLDAYEKLRAALDGGSKDVAILGAGLVGSELANDLALAGHRITLLETQSQPLPAWSAHRAGTQLQQAWQTLPIRFVGGIQLARVQALPASSSSGQRYHLHSQCGQSWEVDALIAATGLETPHRLARSAALAWHDGIAVDTHTMQTSQPQIYALGDCISVAGQSSRFIEPIARQAQTLVAALCGCAPVPYEVRPALVRVKTSSCPLSLPGATA